VERYLDDFCVLMMGLGDGYSTAHIARLRERQASLLKKSLLEGEETGPTPGSAA